MKHDSDEMEVIRVRVSDGDDFIWMSEKAESRLQWIMTGLLALTIAPVFIMAFMI